MVKHRPAICPRETDERFVAGPRSTQPKRFSRQHARGERVQSNVPAGPMTPALKRWAVEGLHFGGRGGTGGGGPPARFPATPKSQTPFRFPFIGGFGKVRPRPDSGSADE